MNRFLKYFMYKTSESAMQASYDKSDSKRQSNIREGKVNPSKDAVSILFLGIDDNEESGT